MPAWGSPPSQKLTAAGSMPSNDRITWRREFAQAQSGRQTARKRLATLCDGSLLFGKLNLCLNLPDPHQHFSAQITRRGIAAAMLCD